MPALLYTSSIPSFLQSKAYIWPLNSTSNGAFKNRINPVNKVHLNKIRCIFWIKQNTLLRPPACYLEFEKHMRLRASRGERESSTAAQITVGSYCQHSWEEAFSHTAKVTGRVLSPRKNLLKAVTLPSSDLSFDPIYDRATKS